MRKHKRWTLALIVALALMLVMAGLVSAASGTIGRVLWANKCPVLGGEVVINQVADTYEVSCVIGDKQADD